MAPEEHLLVKPGDIAYNMMRMWQGSFGLASQEGIVSPAYVVLKPKKAIDPLYATYLFKTKRMLYLFWAYSYGLTEDRLRLYFPDFCRIPIQLPDIRAQREIASALSHWDLLISNTERLLFNCRQQWFALIERTLMSIPKSALGYRDKSSPYPSSVQAGNPKELPPTPDGWRRVPLGQHLHEIQRPVRLNLETAYTQITVRRSRGGVEKRSTLLGAEIKTPTQFYVETGDFLISKRQIVHGACGIVPAELHGAVVSNEYAVMGTDGQIDPRFLRYLSETTYFQQTCFHSSIGVHVEKMLFRLEQWLKWPFNIPPLDEQRRIVELLDAASEQVTSVARQLALLKEEKRALMADLLTGKRCVRIPACAEEASLP